MEMIVSGKFTFVNLINYRYFVFGYNEIVYFFHFEQKWRNKFDFECKIQFI